MRTVLGVSNISFGLPCRGYLNTTFLTMAMSAGLDLAIMNPNTPEMMAAVRAYRVLTCRDPQSTYVASPTPMCRFRRTQTSNSAATAAEAAPAAPGGDALFEAVRQRPESRGLRRRRCRALTMREPLDVVNTALIPRWTPWATALKRALVFLPQLSAGCHRRPGRF